MRLPALFAAAFLAAAGIGCAQAQEADGLHIDIPVALEEAKVVFNLDHAAFDGDQPTGLLLMRLMKERFAAAGTDSTVVAIFHGEIGYMMLDDEAYDRARNWSGGNPYKAQIRALMDEGIAFEECGETMLVKGWKNADLIPGVKVNSGALARIIQLVQDGYVQIQP